MYPANQQPFSNALFRTPTREYRGAPFWSWNGELRQDTLREQIQTFHKMGFGGYFIHSRIGLQTTYLGSAFLDHVKDCHEFGNSQDMLTWLYDEDKWPSGFGGGRVTQDKRFASRYLLFSPHAYPDGFLKRDIISTSRLSKNGNITLLCRYAIELCDGKLVSYCKLRDGQEAEHTWYAYLVVTEKLRWFNNQPYVDSLNPEAIKRFIEVSYEPYAQVVGQHFGHTVPGIFTDEPNFHEQENLSDGYSLADVGIAYTDGMEVFYQERYGESLLDCLPEVFWELQDGTLSKTRYQYYDCVAQMFADGYSKTLGDWCDRHNIMLTGHFLHENSLDGQSRVAGDIMRALRPFALPGVDMLADRHEYVTVKQAQSIARQYGRIGVLSELYGVTNWDFDFRGHKHQGDWQAVLGVTMRVPHLAWMFMSGEAKRDYPSPIDAHTTWYDKYYLIEDHFARINTAMTRGRPLCRIAILHPVESYWMLLGPNSDTGRKREALEERFHQLTNMMLCNLLDFDYICEALLPQQIHHTQDAALSVGEMNYNVVVVPSLVTMRSTTLRALYALVQAGGAIVFMGDIPCYVDGAASQEVQKLAAQCKHIGFNQYALLDALENYRDIDIVDQNFLRSKRLMYQMRVDGKERWMFVANGQKNDQMESNHWFVKTQREDYTLTIKGLYTVQCCDTLNGDIMNLATYYQYNKTCVPLKLYSQDSILLRLTPAETLPERINPPPAPVKIFEQYAQALVDFHLDEPNVLMLDQAEWRLDGGAWQPREEILRLDNIVRQLCAYPLRTESFPQPWLEPQKRIEHSLELCFIIPSETELEKVMCAYEANSGVEIWWNNTLVSCRSCGYFVDSAIQKVELGPLNIGENKLIVQMPFGASVDVEWLYLLGDFGVKIDGDRGTIIPAKQKLAFGNMTSQGFPFYGGNVTYQFSATLPAGDVEIVIPEYYGALLTVSLDERQQDVFIHPHTVRFLNVRAGQHIIRIVVYGTRINTFGQVHNCNRKEQYFGPKTWRTYGENWTYLYQLRKTGITLCPIIRCFKS